MNFGENIQAKVYKDSGGSAIATSTLGCNLFKSEERPMNVVFIMTDQQPTSTLGCYGNPLNPTPNIDRLAQTCIRFSNFYINAFPCSPSRTSMLTGLYPRKHALEGALQRELVLETYSR